MNTKVLVVAWSRSLGLAYELLGAGRSLGNYVIALCFGPGADAAAAELRAHGADEVLWWDDPALEFSRGEAGLLVLQRVCVETGAGVILFSADSIGRDWAPRLAWRLGVGLVTECIGWDMAADGRLRFHRPVYGGKATATIVSHSPVQMAVVQVGAFSKAPRATNPAGIIRRIEYAVVPEETWPIVAEHVVETSKDQPLEEASIIVAGGRGVGNADDFKLLEELARALGGTVGASRAPVDEGWVPAPWQIGQTGKSVCPNLYVAIGISGASQHLSAVRAKTIVAINADKEAPIFDVAHLGVVADYRTILPPLVAALREMQRR